MAYDPNLPANNSPIVSAELRSQFAGLKELIDALPDAAAINDQIIGGFAGECSSVGNLGIVISDPPTQEEVQQLHDKLDELINALKRV